MKRKHPNPISQAMEDYLKVIYELSEQTRRVSTSQVAQRMECSPASVTSMLQKLSSLKLLEYTPYHGVQLTPSGIKVALEIVRHHRLIELYLAEVLGYSWDKVHAEAEQLEHVISEEFEERIDAALGYPERDPHGDPIPTKDGAVAVEDLSNLWNQSEGSELIVRRVSDKDPAVLRYLASLGIYPDRRITLVGRDPFNGPLHVSVGTLRHGLSKELACQIFVIPA